MNSAVKPVLGGTGQASPAKANVAAVNHAVGLPQGANSLHSNSLVGQNLSQHAGPAPLQPHAAPSMAPVSANMAQMAQNMSHHGNLSHLNQNSAPPVVPSPTKAPTTTPLSLVQDKVNASQPLALTRTPEKKETEPSGHSNGSIDSPKSGASAPATLKPQNPEPNKEKQDIAKTSPSTPKPPEKPATLPTTPQKPEGASGAGQVEGAAQPKVATANEAPEKSPSKPAEPTPAPTADVAPSQSDNKPVPESANNQSSTPAVSPPEKPTLPVKQDPPTESAKTDTSKVEEKKETPEKPVVEDKKEEVKEVEKVEPKKEAQAAPAQEKPVEKEAKKVETRPKSTLKLATVTPPIRKRRQTSPAKDGPTPAKKLAEGDSTPESKTKRNRTKVQLYQSPTPELTMATKLSASAAGRATPTKPSDDKLIVFYKNEYLAVRNTEGGFYVCQAMQNVYRTTRKIKIRWLSQDKAADPSGQTYKPDFYDVTDMECVLTTLSLTRTSGGAQILKPAEKTRATSILQRALQAETGDKNMDVTAEHPDGLDLSLYTDESQLDKKAKRNSKSSPRNKNDSTTDTEKEPSPKKAPPKRSPKRKAKSVKKAVGTIQASSSKTATAVTEKAKTPARGSKRTPAKKETPVVTPTRGRRAAKDSKPSPIVATPSTSTGKTTRTPRKPPSRK